MRRKLIEQTVARTTGLGQRFSAASTTAHVSAGVDREGFLSAVIVGTAFSLSVADTSPFIFTVKDSSDNSTFAVYHTALSSLTMTAGTTSTDATVGSFDVDLAGAKRYLQVSVTVTGATTVTAVITTAVILGDAINEPAV